MSSRFDLIAQYLLHKPLDECTVQELQQLTAAQPYLAPAQYLLAKKMLQQGLPEARTQVQKAALYYHQPAAFDAFLNADFPEPEHFYSEDAAEEAFEDEPPLPMSVHLPAKESVIVAEETEAAKMPNAGFESEQQEHNTAQPAHQPEMATTEAHNNAAPAVQQTALPAGSVSDNEETGLPAFEPYHTIDYFASQGIKLSQEEATKDKMGRQLKSFTQWLKTMKRLPATEQLSTLDPNAEQKVEHLAAHSVAEAEILTEAMAEVWLKQGNLDKAAAVYHKLSLSNPAKRAYFAAKLESLKKNV